ncbi:MAG: hypothetical protein GWP67_01910 [Gammaproteobacteria bacterium]|nr:hypothetical protein [Gammaproteobacteria bacterium]
MSDAAGKCVIRWSGRVLRVVGLCNGFELGINLHQRLAGTFLNLAQFKTSGRRLGRAARRRIGHLPVVVVCGRKVRRCVVNPDVAVVTPSDKDILESGRG